MDRSPGVSNQPSSWEEIVEVPDLSQAEVAMVFSDTGLSIAEVEQAANELGCDPLLCSLAAGEIRHSRTVMPHAVRGVLRRYIDWQLDAVAQATGHPASEYRAALLRLSEAMVRGKNIRPTWTTVRGWIDDNEVCQRLTEMVSTGKAIHCDAASETVLFAHDRFLDEICAECISSLLDEEGVRSEPYFAEIIGRAIAENRLTDVAISRVLADNPLAAFCGLMLASDDAVQQRLAPLLVRWAQTNHNDERLPKTLRWEIGRVLVKTDSPVILELVSSLPESWELHLAALRNGSANYGTKYCRLGEGRLFLPGLRDPHRYAIMDHARSHHTKRLAADLNQDLEQRQLSLEIRRACLLLAGFLGMDEFTPGIERCGQNCPSEERPNLVAAAFWAIVRCSNQRYGELLPSVLNIWQAIPERGATDREYPRHSIAVYELGQCSPKWMPDQVAQWLAGIVPSYPGLAPQLDYLLSQVDAPSAFEYQVRKLAAGKREKGDVFSLSFSLHNRWNTTRGHGNQMSEPSRQRLHSIWSNPPEPPEEREYVFYLPSAQPIGRSPRTRRGIAR